MITISLERAMNVFSDLKRASEDEELKPKQRYDFTKAYDKIEERIKQFQKATKPLNEKYAIKEPDGKPKNFDTIKDGQKVGTHWEFSDSDAEKREKELEELLEDVIELKINKYKYSDFHDAFIYKGLTDFIEEE